MSQELLLLREMISQRNHRGNTKKSSQAYIDNYQTFVETLGIEELVRLITDIRDQIKTLEEKLKNLSTDMKSLNYLYERKKLRVRIFLLTTLLSVLVSGSLLWSGYHNVNASDEHLIFMPFVSNLEAPTPEPSPEPNISECGIGEVCSIKGIYYEAKFTVNAANPIGANVVVDFNEIEDGVVIQAMIDGWLPGFDPIGSTDLVPGPDATFGVANDLGDVKVTICVLDARNRDLIEEFDITISQDNRQPLQE